MVVDIIAESGIPLQSAARVPFLVEFLVREHAHDAVQDPVEYASHLQELPNVCEEGTEGSVEGTHERAVSCILCIGVNNSICDRSLR